MNTDEGIAVVSARGPERLRARFTNVNPLSCTPFNARGLTIVAILSLLPVWVGAQQFQLPTLNHALFENGGEERFYVGTVGKPWATGTFGCVRTDGHQLHEGLDIRCLQRDKKGEPTDAVMATAEGTVAYINSRAGLSNYGKYIILRHQVDGLEVYSLYAHLHEIRAGLTIGQVVHAGEPIAIMGRTSNTAQTISKDRAHVHFELDFLVNDHFAAYYKKYHAGERNDHGDWNGQNLVGIDPREVLLEQHAHPQQFNLATYLQQQPELFRVMVRCTPFPWLRRYPSVLKPNPIAEREGLAGYEIAFNFNGLPFAITPRAPSEIKTKSRVQLLSVNAAEQQRAGCGHLVIKRGTRWDLTNKGQNLVNLLTYQ